MTRPRLLLVGAGIQGAGYVTAAHALGAEVWLCETAERVATDPPQVERLSGVRGWSDAAWYGAARSLCDGERPDGVLGFAEPQVIAAALLADEFQLPGPGLRAAALSRDKGMQRAALAAAGVGQPDWHLVTGVDAACGWAARHGRVVAKPAARSGSDGVVAVAPGTELRTALEAGLQGDTMILESLCLDPEFSLEALVQEGGILFLNITEKTTTEPPRFVELGHLAGVELDDRRQRIVESLAATVVDAVGMRHGILHLEFRLGEDATVMEYAVRTPGDFIMDIINLTYGIDLYTSVVELALGCRPSLASARPRRRSYARSGFVTAPPGRILRITGVDAARAMEGVHLCEMDVAEGAEVNALRSSLDRIGSVVVSGPTRDAVDRRLSAVLDAVEVIMDPVM